MASSDGGSTAGDGGERRYRKGGFEVHAVDDDGVVALDLDGVGVEVDKIGGEYHSRLAHPFMAFPTLDELVDYLVEHEGKTWSLYGPGGRRPHGGGTR